MQPFLNQNYLIFIINFLAFHFGHSFFQSFMFLTYKVRFIFHYPDYSSSFTPYYPQLARACLLSSICLRHFYLDLNFILDLDLNLGLFLDLNHHFCLNDVQVLVFRQLLQRAWG